jgi:hypothetical protein
VFRGADGVFTFLDYASGEALQFAERQTGETGAARWVARGKVKMPAGLRDCAQSPGASDLLCRRGDGLPLRFDAALNRIPAGSAPDKRSSAPHADPGALGARWDPGEAQWVLEGAAADGTILFRYLPAQKRWQLPERADPPKPYPP